MKAKAQSLGSVLLLALLLLGGALTLLGTGNNKIAYAQAGSGVIRVSTTGADSAGCGSVASPCRNIQYAIDRASAGDKILVAGGVYSNAQTKAGVTQIAYISKSLTLRGGYNADFSAWNPETNLTALNSNRSGRGVYVSGAITAVIEGFTIRNNSANGLGGSLIGDYDAGGGIYVITATATLSANIIAQNVARSDDNSDGYGGGIYLRHSNSRILNNVIQQNNAATGGGWGSSGVGGALCAEGGAPWVQGNTVTGNQAGGSGSLFSLGQGGGLVFIENTPAVLANTIRNNSAATNGSGEAGGIGLYGCPAFTLTNNIIASNVGGDYGANGIHIGVMSGQPSSGWLKHNTLASNRDSTGAPGIYLRAGVGGTSAVVTAVNNIIADHATGVEVGGSTNATATLYLTRTLWGSGAWANDKDWEIIAGDPPTHTIVSALAISGAPDFLSPGGGDYHIGSASAAVDAGVNAGVTTDIDGDARDANPDIGADEIHGYGLQLRKETPTTVAYPGDVVLYTITVTGSGTAGAVGVVVTDTLPPQMNPLKLGSLALNSDYGGVVTYVVGNLNVGQSAVMTLSAQITSAQPNNPPETLRNTAQAVGVEVSNIVYADISWRATPACHIKINGTGTEYATMQSAIDAALPGDALWIAGTCLGTDGAAQQARVAKSLTLQGGYSADFSTWNPALYTTTLNAQGEGRVLLITNTARVTVARLTLSGGNATGQGVDIFSGAGGGVYVSGGATGVFTRVIISNNTAASPGYGLGGGAAVVSGTLYLQKSILRRNIAASGTLASGYGGGLGALSATVRLQFSQLENNIGGNSFGAGGGVYAYGSQIRAEASRWSFNKTSLVGWGSGGGLFVGDNPAASAEQSVLTNCVFLQNQAGIAASSGDQGSAALFSGATAALLHPTLANNGDAPAISAEMTATLSLTNAIIFSHTVGVEVLENSRVTINGVLWSQVVTPTVVVSAAVQSDHAITGNAALAPDGYHLTANSAAINAGVNAGVPTDIDGDTRDAHPDLGADESGISGFYIYLPLILRN